MILSQSLKQHFRTDGILGLLSHGRNLLSRIRHLDLSGESVQDGKTVELKDGKLRAKLSLMKIHVLEDHVLIELFLVCLQQAL